MNQHKFENIELWQKKGADANKLINSKLLHIIFRVM